MIITAYFTNSNVAQTGLSPTITVVNAATGTKVVDSQSMSAVTNAAGWYSYDYSGFDVDIDYIFIADAGTDSTDDRYPTVASGNVAEAWNSAIEGSYSAGEILKIMAAVLAGKVSISGSDFTFRDIEDSANRVVATTTEDGERTSVTHNVS